MFTSLLAHSQVCGKSCTSLSAPFSHFLVLLPLSLAFAPSVCSSNDLWSSRKPFSLPTSTDQASLHLSPTRPPPYTPGSVRGQQSGRNFYNFPLHGHISTYVSQKDVCFIWLFFSEIESHCAHYFAISFSI